MATTKTLQIYCPTCAAETSHTQDQPSHVLHLLMTLFTAGLWILVWIFASAGKPPAKCSRCGAIKKL